MAAGTALKDRFYNACKVRQLADRFTAADPGFDGPGFQAQVMARLPELELKQRMAWIAACLDRQLPGPLSEIAPVLRAALPPPLDPTLTDGDFGDFIYAPLGELVVMRGLDTPDLALDLLCDITQRFSMEWALRPFLNRWPDEVLARLRHWSRHNNYHVRRLVSEGTRPRLPWGHKIGLDVATPLPLLDRLHADPTRYVTRSVANHLNDICRTRPDLVMDRLSDWADRGGQDPVERAWMTRHALRGLIKAGNPRALAMLGFDPGATIDVVAFEVPPHADIGGKLALRVALCAPKEAAAMVDVVLWRRRADGRLSPRVFKVKQLELPAGRRVDLERTLPLRGQATTYRLHPGTHRIDLQVNGRTLASAGFELRPA
ncbi:hypothetical protein ACFMPD_03415 [Sedimentitalea sp. HM32M-2]|uniref:hypothetical protein n=1 Tax=Sedimentitalea sp. HM32M-2 TaxID=3351566 RepID=UPI0036425994